MTVVASHNPLSGFAPPRVGLLGGSFNPAHDGHRHISLLALRWLRLDMVWWLVSPQNPLKPSAGMARFETRLAVAARTARHRQITVSDIEYRLRTRYTVDTVDALCRRFPRTRFVWLIGADNLVQMPQWHRWSQIFQGVAIAVLDRPPYSFRGFAGKAARRFSRNRMAAGAATQLADAEPPAWVFLHSRLDPTSATAIRDAEIRGLCRPGPNRWRSER